MKKVYWTTKEGVKMDLDYMSPNHLKNAFKTLILAVEKDQEQRDFKKKQGKDYIEQSFFTRLFNKL